jgi:hypothetical protein
VLKLTPSDKGRVTSAELLDVTGRKAMELYPGDNDVRCLPTGAYFFRSGSGRVGKLLLVEQRRRLGTQSQLPRRYWTMSRAR